jgi:replicative DNA helicase
MTLDDLAELAAAEVADHGVRLIALDGIQEVIPDKRSDLREREVGDVVRGLKTLARDLDVAVLTTSHLNRGPEQRPDFRPKLDDLRESGAVTFAADTIVLLYREDAYDRESPRAGEADLIAAMHRQGPTATLAVAFQAHYDRFVDIAQS